jgi:hypothetical protein
MEDQTGREDYETKKPRGGAPPDAEPQSDELANLTAEDLVMQLMMSEGSAGADAGKPAAETSPQEVYTMRPELDGKKPEFREEKPFVLPEGVTGEKAAKLEQAYKSRMHQSEQARKRESERDQGKSQGRRATACRFELNGRCTSGADCEWSHDPQILAEARIANERLPDVCKYFKVGKCERGNECEFSHTLKHEPCKFFHWFGTCQAGERCEFSHRPLNERQQQCIQNQMKRRLKTQACRFFFAGKCKKTDDECAFSHDQLTPDQEVRLRRDHEEERRRAWRDGQRRAGTVYRDEPRGNEGPYVPGL